MELKSTVKNLEGLRRELSVEVPAEIINLKTEQMFKEIRKEKTIKGFRKGKAPMNVIKTTYGDQVKAEVIDSVIKDSYREVLMDKKLFVASDPELKDMKVDDDGSMKYVINVEVYPEIDKVKFDNLKIELPKLEVTDDEVNDYLDHLQNQFAESRVVDRDATDKDVVKIDLKKLLDTKLLLKEDSFPDSTIDLSNSKTIKEFREHIPGMKKGETKEIEIKYADDFHDKQFAGAIIKYEATLKEVTEKIMPEVDDNFAKKTGIGETILEMKLKLREEIQKQKEDNQKKEQKNIIMSQIVEKNQVDVPESTINGYLANVIQDFKTKNMDMSEEDIRKQYKPIGESFFRWNFLYHKLSEQEKIEVLPSDSENLIGKFAQNYNMTPEQAKEALVKSGKIGEIRETLLEEKVIDFLISKAEIAETKIK